MIEALLILAAGIGGYLLARRFVRRRLRFVDAAQSPLAPLVAGITCAVLLSPLALLPIVSGVTPLAFGVGAAFGTASGARFHRRADTELRRLAP